MPQQLKKSHDAQTVVASAARTATGTGDVFYLPPLIGGAVFVLDLTNAATDVGDTLDAYIQTKADGTNWIDATGATV